MTSVADAIKAELDAAKSCDHQARVHRQRAGILLFQIEDPTERAAAGKACGLDRRMIELLCGMAAPLAGTRKGA